MEKDTQDDLSMCPSFSCYSSNRLAEIAVRVAAEDINNNEDEEFEFSLVRDGKEISADDFGQIGPIFPVFNRDLAVNGDERSTSYENERLESSVAIPLGKLLLEERKEHERDDPPSCSSSEADELENIPEGTYCVWRPKAAETPSPSPSVCKKSKSTGSVSKRWKFSDFMRRSNSEGKDSFAFLTPKQREVRVPEKETESPGKLVKGKGAGRGARWSPSAHEVLYVQNRAANEGNKRKSYLPYRQDLVGFLGVPHF